VQPGTLAVADVCIFMDQPLCALIRVEQALNRPILVHGQIWITGALPGQGSGVQAELGDEVALVEEVEAQHRQGAAPGGV
jgi:hypothetical protein